jgi:hypothetical protein
MYMDCCDVAYIFCGGRDHFRVVRHDGGTGSGRGIGSNINSDIAITTGFDV